MKPENGLTVDEIMARARRFAAGAASQEAPAAAEGRTEGARISLGLSRTPFLDVDRNAFDLGELLAFEDHAFVACAYQALLKRDPDPAGMENYLEQLRTHRIDKIGILLALQDSAEGRARQVEVRGLDRQRVKNRLLALPLVGRIIGTLLSWRNLRALKSNLDRQEVRLAHLAAESENAVNRLRLLLDGKADKAQLAGKLDTREMDRYLRAVNQVLDLAGLWHQRLPEAPPASTEPNAYGRKWLDEFYPAFEDAFRGSRRQLFGHLERYLPVLRKVLVPRQPGGGNPAPASARPVLDLGCGRGEWLELLARNDIYGLGVDRNPSMAQQGRERGVNIEAADLFEFLDGQPAASMGAVTCFHVIEHLPFERQLLLMDLCRRVLVPGGLLLMETPNPCNILASAVDFHRDPTHLKPVHPDTLLFLAKSRGFVRAGIYFMEENGAGGPVLRDAATLAFNDPQDYVTVSRDYALLAYKP